MKFGHGSLCCSRALSRVIKVSCRFIIFIYKETLPIFARSGPAQWYSGLWTFISLRAPTRECRKSVSGARKLRLHAANLPKFSGPPHLDPAGWLRTPQTPSSIGRVPFMRYVHKRRTLSTSGSMSRKSPAFQISKVGNYVLKCTRTVCLSFHNFNCILFLFLKTSKVATSVFLSVAALTP